MRWMSWRSLPPIVIFDMVPLRAARHLKMMVNTIQTKTLAMKMSRRICKSKKRMTFQACSVSMVNVM